jgi:diguanylate cyclase (GGDEF)-like protein
MTVQWRSPGVGQTRASLGPPAPLSKLRQDVHPLGQALKERAADVVELTVARASGLAIDPALQRAAERISKASTIALASWLAGEGPDVAREANTETWLFYGELAADRSASLNTVIMHCLCWRDAVAEVLQQSAAQLGASAEALAQALNLLQVGLEFGFIKMSESFDGASQRTGEELAFMATHHELTGLPNRALILDRVDQMVARRSRTHAQVAALFVDVENVKSVTDTLGHAAGDKFIQAIAARLDGVVRDSDALGCLGGSEFVVICEELPLEAGPELTAERLLEVLKPSFKLGASEEAHFTASASIGIAVGERTSAEELLRDAEIAMDQAKGDGKNRYVVFESEMQDAVQFRMELEMDLRDALPNDEFFLVYQPTFNLRDMSPTGLEALIRWRHPIRDTVQPDDFIPLLEATGLIIEVGSWVLREACRQGASWREAGHAIGMAVNVSGCQLDSDDFVSDVRDALTQSGLDAGALTLEITETTLMRNVEQTARRMSAIRQLGVRIAIDDFGTGYSSLSHLQQFQIDALKIDRSFVSRLTQNPEGEALIHTLVQLGKALSIETLAEGIEQEEELSLLQQEQCDSGQGFLYARPLDARGAEAFLDTWAAESAVAR